MTTENSSEAKFKKKIIYGNSAMLLTVYLDNSEKKASLDGAIEMKEQMTFLASRSSPVYCRHCSELEGLRRYLTWAN